MLGANGQIYSGGESAPRSSGGSQSSRSAVPGISLPKGGGAVRGIGEKFAANPVTGTGSMTVPIATSPGRAGFGPQLSLSYDSGAGNGPFGFGWNLSLPSITRKTDKGLPQYRDDEESDVFILSRAEDLVPVLNNDNVEGEWVPEELPRRTVDDIEYDIRRYRPRIEGLFARIERWTNRENGEIHWRSITRDNITTIYGKENTALNGKKNNSRIFDPDDPDQDHPTRIFSWLICQSYDDKGNAIIYEYAEENNDEVDCTQANERNRVRTANRYLKRIKYGNRTPNRDAEWKATDPTQLDDWMFEVVFDYGEGHYEELPLVDGVPEREQHRFVRTGTSAPLKWPTRQDPFSSYRAGFEVRTYRLCRRVLMFHHFSDEVGVGEDCLVRSTEFIYSESPIASFITSVTQSGYVCPDQDHPDRYLKKSLPPLEFAYTEVPDSEEIAEQPIREVDAESVENLPYGLDGTNYQWVDLDGEGISGVLTEQADGWFYKRNLSPTNRVSDEDGEYTLARFDTLELVAAKPAAALAGGQAQFMDLAGDGRLDLVRLDGPVRGFYERTEDADWETFRPFVSFPNLNTRDPNLRFVDLTGDGHADVAITEDVAITWYPSLAETGFGPAERTWQPGDEEQSARLVFADGTQSIYLADLSGDGLTDLVRIRNGEVCYWPNLGYGRFGGKLSMDDAPWFDAPDQFDQRRIRLADIDGSGTTDILYLHGDGVRIYNNQSGNRWSDAVPLPQFPAVENVSSIQALDLLAEGTACLVWSSPLPAENGRPMRYVDLMGGRKPHLLTSVKNNLGAETHIRYAPSTRFYLEDQEAGRPWITRLPFPVHVVDRVETHDRISGNVFVTHYAYHHGYFDGAEREFRGFGMVQQWDTEEFAALRADRMVKEITNWDEQSHVPPVLTKTWFHTGVYQGRERVSRGFEHEYSSEPGLTAEQAQELLLPDTILPAELTDEEEREACRALKGSMLRQEVYALDGTDKEKSPYAVTEQNLTIRVVQPRGPNLHGIFFTHPREAITYHYERNPADPRVSHAMTLEVDEYGNVRKSAAIGYGRRENILVVEPDGQVTEIPNPELNELDPEDQGKQTQELITYTEDDVTNSIDRQPEDPDYDPEIHPDNYRVPLPCETRTYELTGYTPTGMAGRYQPSDFVEPDPTDPSGQRQKHIFDSKLNYEEYATSGRQRRLIERARTLYRPDDLGAAEDDPTVLLPVGQLAPLALPGENYQLAFTPGLIDSVYQREQPNQRTEEPEDLLPDPADVLGGQGADQGGYVDLDGDRHWWVPSGRVFYHPESQVAPQAETPSVTLEQELAEAREHFFLPRRFFDPFGQPTTITYDDHDLLVVRTEDAVENTVLSENAYRVLQPRMVTDPNGNRSEVRFDALGLVVGTAVMGKPEENLGDLLDDDFKVDLTPADIDAFFESDDPRTEAQDLLAGAATRIVYDLHRYHDTAESGDPQPSFAATIARETHVSDGETTEVQVSFSYSDGFGREIQQKIQAEPEPVEGLGDDVDPRWVGSGWTVFNNKGKPVRKYEPFFSTLPAKHHQFEFGVEIGVSPVLFYDPVGRVVATLHPNHTYDKVVFDPWQQTTWDVNDTVLGDPRTDPEIDGYTAGYFASQPEPWETWYTQRKDGNLGPDEQVAAEKAAAHHGTPTTAHLDSLGRPFLTVAHNKVVCPGHALDGTEDKYPTRVELDIEGNQREVMDAKGRVVMRYDYDMAGPDEDEEEAGHLVHQASMEAGERWMLSDVAGSPIRAWDSCAHTFRNEYDPLRRPIRAFVTGADAANPNDELLTERQVYGEQHPGDEQHNLRGRLYLQLDQAGVVASEAYDFKGNPLRSSRRLATEYKQTLDWRAVDEDHAALPPEATANFNVEVLEAALATLLEAETFSTSTTYDALNRPVTQTTPDSSVIRHTYNEANLLETVEANLRGSSTVTIFVQNIDYNAKGQRERIEYGNGATTTYDYDPLTFRLTRLTTTRPADPDAVASQLFRDAAVVQDLHYTYDPVGNLTRIEDAALKTVVHDNQQVDPAGEYVYDALYRLIEARGREHVGQTAFDFNPPNGNYRDYPFVGLGAHPNDAQSLRNYTERYEYDAVGNFQVFRHVTNGGGWTRHYDYEEESLLEPGKQSNRLTRTRLGNGLSHSEPYSHDDHGNMTAMPHLDLMNWDHQDQLQATFQQVVNNGGAPQTTYYVYDAGGQRVRKVIDGNGSDDTPAPRKERIYLGGFEIYREYNGDGLKLQRETLHVMDDQRRIALVETKTPENGRTPRDATPLIRYQLDNHLGSAVLELDEAGEIISYEEYYPYGSTSYHAVRADVESPKRYRYTGKERDDETGLYYYGARYYAPWLGRWVSADPAPATISAHRYAYAANSPVLLYDRKGLQEESGLLSKVKYKFPRLYMVIRILSQLQGWTRVPTLPAPPPPPPIESTAPPPPPPPPPSPPTTSPVEPRPRAKPPPKKISRSAQTRTTRAPKSKLTRWKTVRDGAVVGFLLMTAVSKSLSSTAETLEAQFTTGEGISGYIGGGVGAWAGGTLGTAIIVANPVTLSALGATALVIGLGYVGAEAGEAVWEIVKTGVAYFEDLAMSVGNAIEGWIMKRWSATSRSSLDIIEDCVEGTTGMPPIRIPSISGSLWQ